MTGILDNLINNFSSPEEQWNAHVAIPLGDSSIGVTYDSSASTADSPNGAAYSYAVGVDAGDIHTGVGAFTDSSTEGPHVDVVSSLLGQDLDVGHLDGLHLLDGLHI